MAISQSDYWRRPWVPPEVEIDWFGLVGSAHGMERAGWRFEALEAERSMRDPFGSRRQLIMRHREVGLVARASCDERELVQVISSHLNMRSDLKPCFVVHQVAVKTENIFFDGTIEPRRLHISPLSFEPFMREMPQIRRFSLAEIYPPEAEEIIVDPDTVSSLLERIKSLQAPELAEIRERNRLRDARERAAEVRHATILSIAA
jgi:hypothetical protein